MADSGLCVFMKKKKKKKNNENLQKLNNDFFQVVFVAML